MALGREVPAGFAAGIAQTTALVDRAMENMVPSASFAGGRVGSAGAGGSSTSSTRNFYGGITVVANDSRSFLDELADRESLALPLHVA